jgi:hypothetical protein
LELLLWGAGALLALGLIAQLRRLPSFRDIKTPGKNNK